MGGQKKPRTSRTDSGRGHDYRNQGFGLLAGLVLAGVGFLGNSHLQKSRTVDDFQAGQLANAQERRKEAMAYYQTLAATIEQTIVGWRSLALRLEGGLPVPELRRAYTTYALSLSEWTRQWDASRVLVCDNFGTGAADVYVRRVLRPFHSLQDSLRLRLKTASGQYQKKPPRTPLAFRVDAVADGFREFGSAVLSSQRSHAEHDCSYGDRVLVAIPAGNTDRPADGKLAGRLASTPVDAPYAPMLKKRPMHSRASTAGQLNNTPVIAPYPLPRYVPEDTKSYAPDTGGLRDYAPMDTISDYAPRADTSGFR